jgi:hypothetical protein
MNVHASARNLIAATTRKSLQEVKTARPSAEAIAAVQSLFHELMPADRISRSAFLKLKDAEFDRCEADLGFYISLVVCTRALEDSMGIASVNHKMFEGKDKYAHEVAHTNALIAFSEDPFELQNAKATSLVKGASCMGHAYRTFVMIAARFHEISEKYPCLVQYLQPVMLVVDENARSDPDDPDDPDTKDNHAYVIVGPLLQVKDDAERCTGADIDLNEQRLVVDSFVAFPSAHDADASKYKPTTLIKSYDVRKSPEAVPQEWRAKLEELTQAPAPGYVRRGESAPFDENKVFGLGRGKREKEPWDEFHSYKADAKQVIYTHGDLPEIDTDMMSRSGLELRSAWARDAQRHLEQKGDGLKGSPRRGAPEFGYRSDQQAVQDASRQEAVHAGGEHGPQPSAATKPPGDTGRTSDAGAQAEAQRRVAAAQLSLMKAESRLRLTPRTQANSPLIADLRKNVQTAKKELASAEAAYEKYKAG